MATNSILSSNGSAYGAYLNSLKKPLSNTKSNFTNNLGTTSNVGATSTKPTVITTSKTSPTNTPTTPKDTYIQNQINSNTPTTPQNTPTNTPATPSTNNVNSNTSTQSDNPYLVYLKSMFNPETLKDTSTKLTEANNRLADIQNQSEAKSLEARRLYNAALDNPEGLTSGAREASNLISRRSNSELADLALRESAAARTAGVYQDTYNSMINAGKSVYEAETAAAKAKQDQENENRRLGQTDTQLKQNEEKIKQDKIESDRKFEEDKRQFGLEYALKAKQVAISQQEADYKNPNSTSANEKKNQEASSAVNLINTLLQNKSLGSITGSVEQFRPSLFLGSEGNLAKNQYDQIKGLLSLENRQKLKGQGAVSDFEGKLLESAASSLGRNLSKGQFINQLKQIKGAISTSHGLTAEITAKDPNTGEIQQAIADSASIAKMIQAGLIVEYN